MSLLLSLQLIPVVLNGIVAKALDYIERYRNLGTTMSGSNDHRTEPRPRLNTQVQAFLENMMSSIRS